MRGQVLERLARLATGAPPALPERPDELLAHPIHAAGLADPELATDLCESLGGNRADVLRFPWPAAGAGAGGGSHPASP